jgi:hypothetical protein
MAEERERNLKAAEAAAAEEPDVEGHRAVRRDDAPTVEREAAAIAADDDEPDVEGHKMHR